MSYSPESDSPLHALNKTELYQTCRRVGINVHPRTTKLEMISYLEGSQEAPPLPEEQHPIDAWRLGLINFISDHWKVLQPQLKCPARMLHHPQNPDPRPCFRCTDAQVITCVVSNPQTEHLIQLYKPTGKDT